MQGIIYILTLVFMGFVIHWLFRNDNVGPSDATSGLFAMREQFVPNETIQKIKARFGKKPPPPRRGHHQRPTVPISEESAATPRAQPPGRRPER